MFEKLLKKKCDLGHIFVTWAIFLWLGSFGMGKKVHTDKSILNLVKSNQIRIVITFYRLIYHQTEFILVSNKSEKCNYVVRMLRSLGLTNPTHRKIFSKSYWIRLYLPFSDWFGTKRTVSVGLKINQKMVNTIGFWFDSKRFLCVYCCGIAPIPK